MSSTPLDAPETRTPPVRLTGLPLMTAAAFFSGALAAWLLGTTRPARVIEILSLTAGVLGYVTAQRIRRQTAGRWTLIGYAAFWALAVLISICWILVAATGTTSAA